jgi:hypothetical protein
MEEEENWGTRKPGENTFKWVFPQTWPRVFCVVDRNLRRSPIHQRFQLETALTMADSKEAVPPVDTSDL